jgi:hypothetical protein
MIHEQFNKDVNLRSQRRKQFLLFFCQYIRNTKILIIQMMKNNPLRSDWDIEEDNNVILTKTSINIDKDQSGICSKTK